MARRDASWREVKLSVLIFVLGSLGFSLAANPLGYLLDLTGISGRRPAARAPVVVPVAAKPVVATRPTAAAKAVGLEALPTATPPTIDGQTKDWALGRGIFLTDDYLEHSGTQSAWCHLMYDAQALYLLARLRDREPLHNNAKPLSDPTAEDVVQFQFDTDQQVVLNAWRNDAGKALLQAFYPARDGKVEKRRVNALAAGAQLAVADHTDGFGCDVEAAVPWALLSRTGQPCRPGQAIEGNVAVRVSAAIAFGSLVASEFVPDQLGPVSFLARVPATATPVLDASRNTLFPVRQEGDVLKVGWDRPLSPFHTWNRRLPIVPAPQLMIDGSLADWPGTAGIVCAESARQPDVAVMWLQAATDATALYLAAMIFDLEPDQPTDGLELHLQTDRRHVLRLGPRQQEVDGRPLAAIAGAKQVIALSGDGIAYVFEVRIPWASLGGRPTRDFPVTAVVTFNPKWQVFDLQADCPAPAVPADPAAWGRAVFIEAAPDEVTAVPVVAGGLVSLAVHDARPLLLWAQDHGWRGWGVLRNPWATDHRYLDVLPGTPTIDGEAGDWDLSGGVFMCRDVTQFRDSSSAWLHAMYDRDYLYFLWRYRDPTPLGHRTGLVSHGDDCCQIRLNAGQIRHFDLFYSDGRSRADMQLGAHGFGGNGVKAVPVADPLPLEQGLRVAYRPGADGASYCQEIAIPWKLITPEGQPLGPGATCRLTAECRTDRNCKTGDLLTPGGDWFMIFAKADNWGEARFHDRGPVTPQPVRLCTGQRFAVTMVDGVPQVDWAPLAAPGATDWP